MCSKKFISLYLISVYLVMSAFTNNLYAASERVLAFPCAEGGGMYTQGARGATDFEIYHVTNLNDSGNGSFRDAVSEGNRIIVFDISGNIMLKSILRIKNINNITILGQTAPGDGICIAGESTFIENCNNIIIRYMRFRPGDLGSSEEDGLGIRQCKDVIVDHCSITWSVDETFSAYANRNFTAQYNIISNSLNNSVHTKGRHGYGGIWGGENVSFHHNLVSSHYSRLPRIGTSETVQSYQDHPDSEGLTDIRNNIFYNWGNQIGYGGENNTRVNFINNYYRKGPASKKEYFYQGYGTVVYAEGNIMEGNSEISKNNSLGFIRSYTLLNDIGTNGEFLNDYPINTETAEQAYNTVLERVGASYVRDDIDKDIINNVINRTAPSGSKGSEYLIDTQDDVGGWVYLDTTEKIDSDNDGISDDWENKNGLDCTKPYDAKAISSNGYTNIENYANDIVKTSQTDKTVNTKKLRQSIFKAENFNKDYYYTDGFDALTLSLENGKAALYSTQAEIDLAQDEIENCLNFLKPRYKLRLADYIEQLKTEDESFYIPQEWNEFQTALNKAMNDLKTTEDNDLFKEDYENLYNAYNNLSASNIDLLFNALEQANDMLSTKYVYTTESLDKLSIDVQTVEKRIDEGALTAEIIEELLSKVYSSISSVEKIKYSLLDNCIMLIDNGVLNKEFVDTDTLSALNSLRSKCETLKQKKFENNAEIDEISEFLLKTVKNIDYGSSKNYLYIQDFEKDKPTAIMGNYTIETNENNSYAKITEPVTLLANTKHIGLNNIYYSVDYSDIKSYWDSAILGLIFDDKYNVIISSGQGYIAVSVKQFDSGNEIFQKDIYSGYIYVPSSWNNITANFAADNKILTIYCNNNKICELDMPSDCGNISGFGIIDNSYKSSYNNGFDNNILIDNIAIYTLNDKQSNNEFIYGDVDCDNEVTASDSAFLLQKTLISTFEMPIQKKTDNWMKYSDVDCDNEITASDAAFVLQKTLISTYIMPAEKDSQLF